MRSSIFYKIAQSPHDGWPCEEFAENVDLIAHFQKAAGSGLMKRLAAADAVAWSNFVTCAAVARATQRLLPLQQPG